MYAILHDKADGADSYEIKPGESLIVGRSYLRADIHIDDPLVSRNHCRIWLKDDGVYVVDLKSSNGSLLGGKAMPADCPMKLVPGEILQIGRRSFEVEIVDAGGGDFLDRAFRCAVCHNSISLETFAEGDVVQEGLDRFLCPRCRGREKVAHKVGTTVGSQNPSMLPDFDILQEEGLPPRLDDYEILDEIGHGRMGSIYKAVKKSLGIQVAIKTLNAELADVGEHVKRFHREARTEAKLRHKNIVQVYDVGKVGDSIHYIVMELVDGVSIYDYLLDRGPLNVAETLSVLHQMIAALECAFSYNIVHRDIKPQNIMLTREGTAKLCDFGLAKDLAEGFSLTARDVGMGTLAYMPPEQYQDAAVADARADIYALGATTFHMLTGNAVFDADDLSELVDQIFYSPPDLDRLPAEAPDELRKALAKMLEKEPDDRYQSPGEIRKDLDATFRRYLGNFYGT